jgi:hypothetical protein
MHSQQLKHTSNRSFAAHNLGVKEHPWMLADVVVVSDWHPRAK